MGKLVSDRKLWVNRRDAANLVQTVEALQTQYNSVDAEMKVLKTKIQKDVKKDIWVPGDLTRISELVSVSEQIIKKRPIYKANLIALKTKVLDADYETEIQASINTL